MAVLRLLILVQLLAQIILSFSYELAFSGDYCEQNFSKKKSEFHSQRIQICFQPFVFVLALSLMMLSPPRS